MTASVLELAGMLAACGGASAAIVARDDRTRLAAAALALAAAPALIAGDVWDQERFESLRGEPAKLAALALAGGAGLAALAAAFRRFDWALPVTAFALIALRVPLKVGDETSNLLIPLYLVIAAGLVAWAWDFRGKPASSAGDTGPTRWLRLALAATLVLYAVQAAYTEDVSNAIENVAFFLVPFAILFVLLAERRWDERTLAFVLAAVAVTGVGYAAVGIWQYGARELILNQDLLDSNQIHLYFRVNSLFRDPNVYGRFLALAVLALAGWCAYAQRPRWAIAAAAAAAITLAGLAFSFSISSFAALIGGLVIVTALRFGWRWALAAIAAGLACAVVFAAAGGLDRAEGPERGIDAEASGRVELFEGGAELAGQRPLWGYGSGSFGAAFTNHVEKAGTTNSHAEPLTVAAEQGAIGLAVYAALLASAAIVLLGATPGRDAARCIVAATFAAMLIHSLGYAAFITDPITWALLALGVALRPAGTSSPRPANG